MVDDVVAEVVIDADPAEIFAFFTQPQLLESWMGDAAFLDPREGGTFALEVGGASVRGRYVEIEAPCRLVISWGFHGSEELPPEASLVEITLTPDTGGTRVRLRHRILPGAQRERHEAGWVRYLARLVTIVPVRLR